MITPSPQPLQSRQTRSITVALYVNAALLAGVLLVLLARQTGGRSPFESVAWGQPAPQPIAGGAGFYLMPAQFDANRWGCYVMDVDAQTLVAYQYNPRGPTGNPVLQLMAARSFRYDRQLENYNTHPRPSDVRGLAQQQGTSTGEPTNESSATPPGADDAESTSRPVVPNN